MFRLVVDNKMYVEKEKAKDIRRIAKVVFGIKKEEWLDLNGQLEAVKWGKKFEFQQIY